MPAIESLADTCRLTLFAAASTTDVLTEVARQFERENNTCVRLSFASSSTLARQIERGAPAHVFLSANAEWMNYLEARGAIQMASRRDLLSNTLVLVAPTSTDLELPSPPDASLPRALGDRYLVMGDPAHVPAGRYGRQALEALGLWAPLEGRVAYAASVREALTLVARNEAAFGITYATDARISEDVRIVARFPDDTHERILYSVAIVQGDSHPAARILLAFLESPWAREVYKRYGFGLP